MNRLFRNLIKPLSFIVPIAFATALPTAAQAQVRIMAVGDSITAGFTFNPPNGTGQGTASYREEFENLLDQSGCSYQMVGSRTRNDPENPFVFGGRHEGYSGHRADHFISGNNGANQGIDAMMLAQSPDVVLLHLGSNDMNVSQNIGTTVSEIEDIISRILNANGNAKVLVANVIPWFGASNNPNITNNINALGNQITSAVNALGNPNVILADVRSGYTQSLMQQDGIHPNTDGEAHIADAFATAFESSGICAQFDSIDPATFITNPTVGGTVSTSANFSGTATDLGGSGFNRVNIAIERINSNGNNTWYNFTNGGFGPITVNGVDVGITTTNLTNTTLTSTNWDFSANLPAGNNYRLYVLAVDNAGNNAFSGSGLSVWPVNQAFVVSNPDITAPTVQILSPSTSTTITPATRTISGTSSDTQSGVDRVGVVIRRVDANPSQHWDGNAWVTASTTLTANLNNNGNWNIPSVDLTATGTYRVFVNARDNAGNIASFSDNLNTTFVVQAADNTKPTVQVVSPATSSNITPATRNITGTSNDAQSGVDRVGVIVRRIDVNPSQHWNGSAWVTASTTLTAFLNNNGNWNIPSVNLTAVGSYRVFVNARDNSGNISTFSDNPITNFDVQVADNTKPSAQIVSPANGSNIAPATRSISGNSNDNQSGVNRVGVVIRRVDVNPSQHWNGNAWVTASTTLIANLNNNGSWNISGVDLTAAGTYRLFVNARDNNGNVASFSDNLNTTFDVQSADNTKPTVQVLSPASGSNITPTTRNVTGTSNDTQSGVSRVRVVIRRVDVTPSQHWNGNAWVTASTNLTANLNNNGNWNIPNVDLTAVGTYRVFVNARDNSGNVSTFSDNPVTSFNVVP